MIKLTRLDGSEMYLNPDLIEVIEETPDTHITLLNGRSHLFLEPAAVIIERIVTYKARIQLRCQPMLAKKYLRRKRMDRYHPYCKLDR
jgi:flagellar protein FlbD